MNEATEDPAIPSTKKAAAAHFIGTAWVSLLTQPGNPTDCVVGRVTFEPGARNSWHAHPARLLRPGDAVTIAPGLVHWHGATATRLFPHLAIGPTSSQGAADWGPPVTDEEYQAAHT